MLDLRYEARDIDQNITSQEKIDKWFEVKTKGLNEIALAIERGCLRKDLCYRLHDASGLRVVEVLQH